MGKGAFLCVLYSVTASTHLWKPFNEPIMHPLDNVIWQDIGTRHVRFAQGNGLVRKFVPEVSSLAAFLEPTPAGYHALASLMAEGDVAALGLQAPQEPPGGWAVVRAAPMLQMVHQG